MEYPDLLTPEWDIFTSFPPPDPTDDFTLRRPGVPPDLSAVFSDVVQAERLREVRALTGFTRLDAPDPEDPDLVKRARRWPATSQPGCLLARFGARASSFALTSQS